jgi:methylenetetrahydrofolate dehydrogenase (NADP+)/methenyltetrahydrofolate cyclohydrolase
MAQARIIDGKTIAAEVIARVTAETAALKAAAGIVPGLAVVLVGTDPASQVYVANKGRMAEACGFASFQHTLPAETAQHELLDLIGRLDRDPAVHGILVQLPLPKPLDADAVIGAISPAKDVDGLHEVNAGRVALGVLDRAFVPCTPAGAMVLIRSVLPDLSGQQAVVIGRSTLVGKPIASLLLGAHCTVTIAHSRTRDLPGLCRQADLLVAAVGRPEMVKGDWIKPGAVVIDVGINRVPAEAAGKTKLVGDVAFAEALDVAGALTPVPGGVGPMTIALLMQNTLLAAKRGRGGE